MARLFLIAIFALTQATSTLAGTTGINARRMGLTETLPYTINDQLCRTQAKPNIAFCIQESGNYESTSAQDLKEFIQDFPNPMLRDWGLYSPEATQKLYGKNSKKVVPDSIGLSLTSNVFGFVFEKGLKKPEMHIGKGIGPRAIDNRPGIYIRVPLPFSKKQMADWAKENSPSWAVSLLSKDFLNESYDLLTQRRCGGFHNPQALRIRNAGAERLLDQYEAYNQLIDQLAGSENCRTPLEEQIKRLSHEIKGKQARIDDKIASIKREREALKQVVKAYRKVGDGEIARLQGQIDQLKSREKEIETKIERKRAQGVALMNTCSSLNENYNKIYNKYFGSSSSSSLSMNPYVYSEEAQKRFNAYVAEMNAVSSRMNGLFDQYLESWEQIRVLQEKGAALSKQRFELYQKISEIRDQAEEAAEALEDGHQDKRVTLKIAEMDLENEKIILGQQLQQAEQALTTCLKKEKELLRGFSFGGSEEDEDEPIIEQPSTGEQSFGSETSSQAPSGNTGDYILQGLQGIDSGILGPNMQRAIESGAYGMPTSGPTPTYSPGAAQEF